MSNLNAYIYIHIQKTHTHTHTCIQAYKQNVPIHTPIHCNTYLYTNAEGVKKKNTEISKPLHLNAETKRYIIYVHICLKIYMYVYICLHINY